MELRKTCLRLSRALCVPLLAFFISSPAIADEQSPWTVANLGAQINTAHEEGFPTITKNGLALYFARWDKNGENDGGGQDWNIYVSTRANLDAPWGKPRLLPDHINTGSSEHSVSFSTDGHWLYFSSSGLDTCGGLDIFRSYREDVSDELAWGPPQNLGCDVNTTEHDVCVIYHMEEDAAVNLYFVSNRQGTSGHLDVWRIGFNPEADTYSKPEVLTSVSSPVFDGHLDPEAGYLWTAREGGYGGGDIWHSDRDAQGNWMAPVNLGPGINTEYEEQLPSPFEHGRIIYFPSDRPGGRGGLDIYIAEKTSTEH